MELQNAPGRKYGRPKLSPLERRVVRLTAGFTTTELQKIEARANAAGVEVSELIRHLVLNQQINSVPQVNRQAYAELARLAGNLNQLAHHLNAGSVAGAADLAGPLDATLNAVQQLRAELLGAAA